jgi:transcriptional regulator with PAS, ATPase and Fis domain
MFGSHVGRQNADELPLCQQESTILSDDLIVYIITFLPDDIETLKILESISKQFRNAATSEMLWKKIFEQRHGYKNIQIQNYRYACLELQRYAIQQVHNKIKKNEAQEYRIIFAGNNGVGKEALQQRICGDYFVQEYDPVTYVCCSN